MTTQKCFSRAVVGSHWKARPAQSLLTQKLDPDQANAWVSQDAGSDGKHLWQRLIGHQVSVAAEIAQGLSENTSPSALSQLEVLLLSHWLGSYAGETREFFPA